MTSNPYVWTQDSMLNDMADENPSIVNENLNYLKYETDDLRSYGTPFSVNSGTRDVNGYASFITKINNNEVAINSTSFENGVSIGASGSISGISISGQYSYIASQPFGLNGKVYKSDDNGSTWAAVTDYGGTNVTDITSYGNNIYLVDYTTNKVYRSTNNGSTWNSGVAFGGTNGNAIAAYGSNVYVACAGTGNIYKSVDSGATWSIIGSYSGDNPWALEAIGNIIYLNDADTNKLYKSVDGGATWDSGTYHGAQGGAGLAVYNNNVYVLDSQVLNGKLYKSVDGGATWDSGTYYSFLSSFNCYISIRNGSMYITGNDNKLYRQVSNSSLTLTYADGTRETHDTLPNITGISADGTYTVLLEKGTGTPIATTSAVTESWGLPASGTNGDYVCDISVKPLQVYKRVSGAWLETQYVKLGQFTRTAGTIATPVSYAFNGVYISPLSAPLTTSASLTLNHNIGTEYINCEVYLINKIAEQGYTIGDKVKNIAVSAAAGIFSPLTPSITKNTIYFKNYSFAQLIVQNKSTGTFVNITNANWDMLITAKKDI